MNARLLTLITAALALSVASPSASARPLWGRDTAGYTQAVASVPAQATVHVPDDDSDNARPVDLSVGSGMLPVLSLSDVVLAGDQQLAVSISVRGVLRRSPSIDSAARTIVFQSPAPHPTLPTYATPTWLVGAPAPFAPAFIANVPASLIQLTRFDTAPAAAPVYATWTITSL